MKQDNLINLILQNAQKINTLKDTSNRHLRGDEFWNAYNDLAFPGGLDKGLELLAQQDHDIIPVAIAYLKANPYYFRSGYIKKKIAHLLKKADLTQQQVAQLQEILITLLTSNYWFYMEYCRLARKIRDEKFQEKIQNIIAQSHDAREIRRAKKMLESMRS